MSISIRISKTISISIGINMSKSIMKLLEEFDVIYVCFKQLFQLLKEY